MSNNTVRVRCNRQFRYDYEQYGEGDEIDVPEQVVARHPQSLTIIEDEDGEDAEAAADSTDDSVDAVPEDELDPHPSDLTVAEIEERIDGIEDVALVTGIRQAETANKNRDTAIEAIDDRLDAIEAEEE